MMYMASLDMKTGFDVAKQNVIGKVLQETGVRVNQAGHRHSSSN